MQKLISFFIFIVLGVMNYILLILMKLAERSQAVRDSLYTEDIILPQNPPMDLTQAIGSAKLSQEISGQLAEHLLVFIESWFGQPIIDATTAGLTLDAVNILSIKLNAQYIYSVYLTQPTKPLADHIQDWEELVQEEMQSMKRIVADKLYELSRDEH